MGFRVLGQKEGLGFLGQKEVWGLGFWEQKEGLGFWGSDGRLEARLLQQRLDSSIQKVSLVYRGSNTFGRLSVRGVMGHCQCNLGSEGFGEDTEPKQ